MSEKKESVIWGTIMKISAIIGILGFLGYNSYDVIVDKIGFNSDLKQAEAAFNQKKYDDAVEFYKKAEKTNEGYIKFLNKAEEMIKIRGYADEYMMKLLYCAKELEDTPKVNELINKYK